MIVYFCGTNKVHVTKIKITNRSHPEFSSVKCHRNQNMEEKIEKGNIVCNLWLYFCINFFIIP